MNKEEVVWHGQDEYVVMEEDGWKIMLVANHFKNKFRYEIETPDNYWLPFSTENIYEAIEKLNEEKKNAQN